MTVLGSSNQAATLIRAFIRLLCLLNLASNEFVMGRLAVSYESEKGILIFL